MSVTNVSVTEIGLECAIMFASTTLNVNIMKLFCGLRSMCFIVAHGGQYWSYLRRAGVAADNVPAESVPPDTMR